MKPTFLPDPVTSIRGIFAIISDPMHYISQILPLDRRKGDDCHWMRDADVSSMKGRG